MPLVTPRPSPPSPGGKDLGCAFRLILAVTTSVFCFLALLLLDAQSVPDDPLLCLDTQSSAKRSNIASVEANWSFARSPS